MNTPMTARRNFPSMPGPRRSAARRGLALGAAAVLALAAAFPATLIAWNTDHAAAHATDAGIDLKLRLPGARSIHLTQPRPNEFVYVIEWKDGSVERLSPQQFSQAVHDQHTGRSFLYLVLNISSPIGIAWVALGLLGQVLFTGRMLVQWLASERSRRSVVPVAFWWMSLGGASMLLVYFIWRRDIVGVLGQSAGWIVYMRNLVLIRRSRIGPPLQPA